MRLIDTDKLCARLSRNATPYFTVPDIENAPTVDAVVVTRCKECKHSWEDISGLCCSHGVCVDLTVPGDFYCAYGERKP